MCVAVAMHREEIRSPDKAVVVAATTAYLEEAVGQGATLHAAAGTAETDGKL